MAATTTPAKACRARAVRIADTFKYTTTMTQLPPCPKCNSEYTYEDGANLVCPECAHEWSATQEDAAEARKGRFTAAKQARQQGDQNGTAGDLSPLGGIFGSFLKETVGLDGSLFPDIANLAPVKMFGAAMAAFWRLCICQPTGPHRRSTPNGGKGTLMTCVTPRAATWC